MSDTSEQRDLGADLARELPFLRRYARALTGAQDSGDQYAVATLEAIVADPSLLDGAPSVKAGLFHIFHGIWITSGAQTDPSASPAEMLEERAQWRLQGLSPNTREALLLRSIEQFTFADISYVMGTSIDEAEELYACAMTEMSEMVSGGVMIIEDEAIISMDLSAIVSDMGHTVLGVARTRDAAVALGTSVQPDLILADIQLADKSSGVDAVNDLLEKLGERPVIFITAFPERLLTGERPEPAFMITKPYAEEQVRAAVSQALFFATTREMAQIA